MGWAGEKLANEIVGLSMSPKAVKCECGKSIVQLGATEFWRLEESGEVCADGHWHKPAQVTPPKPIDRARAEGTFYFYCSDVEAGVRNICTTQCKGCADKQQEKLLGNNNCYPKPEAAPAEAIQERDVFIHEPDCPCYEEQHSQDCANCECQCTRPPKGWRCTREVGHAGPCAAVPVEPESPQAEGVQRWRKKPVTIEALLWDGTNADAVKAFCPICRISENTNVLIPTLEGRIYASKGDYIIKGVAGEFYPCKPDIFKATYEPVESQPSSLAGFLGDEELVRLVYEFRLQDSRQLIYEDEKDGIDVEVPTYNYRSLAQHIWNAARQQSQPLSCAGCSQEFLAEQHRYCEECLARHHNEITQRQQSQPAPTGKVFDELWKDFIQDAEVEPSPEEEGFARWGWNMASGDYANGYIDGREAGYHSCGSCSHAWEAHDGECGAYMPDGSICGCTWGKRQQSQPVIEPLAEVVQKLVDTNFWHPFSLPLSRAQQDIINMANNALQQFRKAQKERSK